MITLITGAPGAGKSAALVSLLAELAPGRTIYAHGIPDFQVDHQPLADPSKWMSEVPDGSIVVIDEVQTVWRPRGPGQGVPPDIQALETHRHRGLDFYIVTQAPRLVHTNVRALVGRHVHLRDVGFMGRFWYEWPECAENCTAAFKSAPLRKKYKLPKKAFALYRSASVHVKPIRSFPFMVFVAGGALLATAAAGWYSYQSVTSKMQTPLNPALSEKARTPANPPPVAYSPAPPEPVNPGYDPTVFIPTNPRVPESAPAYDHLRVVVAMPSVAGGLCSESKGCKCYTASGNPLPMTSNDCREVLESNTFNPWRLPPSSPAPSAPGAAPAPVAANPALVAASAVDGGPTGPTLNQYPPIMSPLGRGGSAHSPVTMRGS